MSAVIQGGVCPGCRQTTDIQIGHRLCSSCEYWDAKDRKPARPPRPEQPESQVRRDGSPAKRIPLWVEGLAVYYVLAFSGLAGYLTYIWTQP